MDEKFLESMDSQLVGWDDPVERLHAAIERDEFELYCQPILGLRPESRFPLGEVLVRLREEERALLPPGEFLPVLEHYGMMPELDRWVVRHTLERLARGSRIARFTVNLSGQTLADAQFPHFVAAELAARRICADRLLFEIGESDALHNLAAAKSFAQAYRALGGALLLDGFGRRAVSFDPVRELGVQFVKADGAITRRLLASEAARNKLNAMLRVGEVIGYAIVAECVEEQDVLVRLKAMGVHYAQGFGIYQPHPIDRLTQPA